MTQRYNVYGSYADPQQVVCDVVDAESAEQAEAIVYAARNGDHSDYVTDGATLLTDELANITAVLQASPEAIAAGIAELTAHYADDEDDSAIPARTCRFTVWRPAPSKAKYPLCVVVRSRLHTGESLWSVRNGRETDGNRVSEDAVLELLDRHRARGHRIEEEQKDEVDQ